MTSKNTWILCGQVLATTFRVNLGEMRVVFSLKKCTNINHYRKIFKKYPPEITSNEPIFLWEHIITCALLYFSLYVNINEMPTQAFTAEAHVESAESLLRTCVVL